jgi:aminopeptidase-like protein
MSRSVLDIVRSLYPYAYSVVSAENDRAVDAYLRELDFRVVEFPSGAELNGWIVPPSWRALKAEVRHEGRVILDATASPLGVGVLSPSFSGRLSRDELRRHLFYSEECPQAIPYHWINLYRPAAKDWALCVTKAFHDGLADGEYEVKLVTEERPGTMKVFDFLLPGRSPETVLLNAHNCHPWQANDDLSGCAVGIAALQQLMQRPERRYSYRLVIAPELIGSVHWLEGLGDAARAITGGVMLKSVGNAAPLRLQHSFDGESQLDKAATCVLRDRFGSFESGAFRTIYGNDETVFDSPGFEIPSISLTRFPFVGYHTSADTPETLSPAHLQESLDVVMAIVDALEANHRLVFAERGLVALSHPRYDLYRAAPAPGLDKAGYQESSHRWNLLMNCLPRELDGRHTAVDLAHKYGLPVADVCAYLGHWRERKLACDAAGA